MDKPNEGHWTVVKWVKNSIIKLSDSYGRQQALVRDFEYGAVSKTNKNKKYTLDSTSLVLITVMRP